MEKAVRDGNLDLVQELIQRGEDVNARCKVSQHKDMPLLSLAIKLEHDKIALELINHGANVGAKDGQGMTALHRACEVIIDGREVLVRRLVEEGCSVHEEDGEDRTPLMLAAKWGGTRVANCLIKADAECHALPKKQKNLVVRYACRESEHFVVEKLIDNGCDINTRFASEHTLLMKAVEVECEDTVKKLISKDANLNLQDKNGYTALHHAAISDHVQCGVLLTEGGANVGVKDKRLQTAHDVASSVFRQAIEQAQSFTVSRIVCILGNSGVGKSKLVAALQAERNSFLGKIFNRFKRISDHCRQTAGIEPIHHHSQRYGEALFFDFAGQHEYHGPHQPFLESLLSKLGVPLTLLMVVKLTDGEEAIVEQLHYWLFPVLQMATTTAKPPRVFVIGSYLDQVESNDAATAKLQRCIKTSRRQLACDTVELKFVGSCLLNCRQPQSEGIDKLCCILGEVPIPELKAIHTSYSLAWVLSQIRLAFTTHRAVPLHTLEEWIKENRDNLPQAIPSPEEVCKDLSTAGHALYLPNKSNWHNSWLVLDLPGILHDVYGTLFSQPKETMNTFGLLHCQELARLFPQMSLEMVQQLFISLEFCTPVDLMLLSEDVNKLTKSKEDSGWLFFPAFVSADPPKAASDGHSQQSIHSLWWQLRTCDNHVIFARVMQTILLHMAASFVGKHDNGECQRHSCSVWQNGISWQSNEGIDVSIYITNRELHVVGTSEERADKLYQYLMKVIDLILSTVHQVSPNLKADAYIVHRAEREALPCEVFELPPPSPKKLFPVADIVGSIKEEISYALSQMDGTSRIPVSDLFGGHTPTQEDVERILWPQPSPMQCQSPMPTTEMPQPQPTATAKSPQPLPTPTAEPPQPLPTPTAEPPQPLPTPTAEDRREHTH